MSQTFPFPAIVAQEELKKALLIAAVDRTIGGVLLFGDRGTGKSTAIRALAKLLPPMEAEKAGTGGSAKRKRIPVPVVDLPLGVTEDRVVGALDIEKALAHGEKSFEPGLLARADRGFLYIDEVNLLEDHIVDLLLDVAASGENVVERDGISFRHPARFVLVGSGNPEEGELRPQLLDRFGLAVEVETPKDLESRIEVLRRRDQYELDRRAFVRKWAAQEGKLRNRIKAAREKLKDIAVKEEVLRRAAELCMALQTDGSRGEITLIKAARSLAALEGHKAVKVEHLIDAAPMALAHRLRRSPLDTTSSRVRVDRAIEELFGT